MRKNEFLHDELLTEFYGLDAVSLAVDCVSIRESGNMHRWTDLNGYVCARMSGPSMQAEVTRHFALIYLVAVEPSASVELRKQIIRELQNTARLLMRR
jgi:hypothetical protein